jgi:hypothetical protein
MPRKVRGEPKGAQMFRVAVFVLALIVSAMPAVAADETAAPASTSLETTRAARMGHSVSRPTVLPALYASYAGLQVYDAYSTKQALARGARETNPLMQPVVGTQSAFWAVKASATAGTILAAERLWRKNNRKGAIAVLVASNAVAAVVAARNASVLRSQR